MLDLKSHRLGWDEREQIEREIETEYLNSLTVEQLLELFQALYESAIPFLDQVNAQIDIEREQYLVELQTHLQRHADWQETKHGKTI